MYLKFVISLRFSTHLRFREVLNFPLAGIVQSLWRLDYGLHDRRIGAWFVGTQEIFLGVHTGSWVHPAPCLRDIIGVGAWNLSHFYKMLRFSMLGVIPPLPPYVLMLNFTLSYL
jgi:hypothetical protein